MCEIYLNRKCVLIFRKKNLFDSFFLKFFYLFRILSIFNTFTHTHIHEKRGISFLKKLTEVYIQNDQTFNYDQTLGYTTQPLNLFNSYSFSNVGLTHCFFF